MVTVLGESSAREELEAKFLHQYVPFAKSWSMSRDRRVTVWTSPSGRRRVLVECVAHEYRDPRDVAGHIAEALTWDGLIQHKRPDGTWKARLPKKERKKLQQQEALKQQPVASRRAR